MEPKLIRNKKLFNNQSKLMIVLSVLFISLFLGTSYSILTSTDESEEVITFTAGELNLEVKTNTDTSVNFPDELPKSEDEVEKPLILNIKNSGNLTICEYRLKLLPDTTQTSDLPTNYIRFSVSEDNGTSYSESKLLSETNNQIYIGFDLKPDPNITKTIYVKIWLDESASEDENLLNKSFYGKIDAELLQRCETEKPVIAVEQLKSDITSHTTESCNPTVVDGDTTYFSGTNDCVNFNYVWYSGKLWRITAINSDNTMKMITQDAITAIHWGPNTTYQGSWIYQWLNEDFLDTLENQENIIVQDAKWYATEDGNSTPVKPTGETIEGKVGLLNAYEYTQAYKNAANSTNYLNIGYYWWLITPYNSSNVRYVDSTGILFGNSPSSDAYGVRPSVNLKSDIKISGGAGTKEDPYRIVGDKTVAQVNDKLNSRVSGEYVNFDGKKYRIVGIENDTTKLTSVDYVREAAADTEEGAVMTKNFGSNANWGTSVSTDNEDTYWSHYLNNTWYNSINKTYKDMLVQGIYYLGEYPVNVSYKNTICSASNTTETTKECNKTGSFWKGYVGLPRVGEMFSAMLGNGYVDTATDIWLITPYSSFLSVRYVYIIGYLSYNSPSSRARGVRPSINLKSDILISSGEGTLEIPYEIKQAS